MNKTYFIIGAVIAGIIGLSLYFGYGNADHVKKLGLRPLKIEKKERTLFSHEVKLTLSSGEVIKVKRPYSKHSRRSFDAMVRKGKEIYVSREEKVIYASSWTGTMTKYDLL